MDNKTALNIIYNSLMKGTKYGKFSYWDYYNNKPLLYPGFDMVIYKDPVHNLFHWSHYGSSANKATKKDLKWIITTIFKTTPEKFLLEYITNIEYQRIETAIKAYCILKQRKEY